MDEIRPKQKENLRTKQKKRVFLEALERNLGVITPSMKEAGVNSRQTIKNWRDNDSEFRMQMEQIECVAGDFVENALLKRIKNEDTTAIIFYCKTKLKSRGYVERNEVTGANGRDINPSMQIEIIDSRAQVQADESTNNTDI